MSRLVHVAWVGVQSVSHPTWLQSEGPVKARPLHFDAFTPTSVLHPIVLHRPKSSSRIRRTVCTAVALLRRHSMLITRRPPTASCLYGDSRRFCAATLACVFTRRPPHRAQVHRVLLLWVATNKHLGIGIVCNLRHTRRQSREHGRAARHHPQTPLNLSSQHIRPGGSSSATSREP